MNEPKDDSFVTRSLSLIVALVLTVLAVLTIHRGHVTVGERIKHDFSASQDPVAFWTYVGLYLVVAALFFYIGLKNKGR